MTLVQVLNMMVAFGIFSAVVERILRRPAPEKTSASRFEWGLWSVAHIVLAISSVIWLAQAWGGDGRWNSVLFGSALIVVLMMPRRLPT